MSDDAINANEIVVLLYPDCIEYEIMLAMEICNQTLPCRIATPDGKGHRGSSGIKIEADYAYDEVDLNNCEALLIPGGDTYELIEGKAAKVIGGILVEACERQIPIGAICAGPAVLGKHGILKSRKFTHGFGDHHKEFLEPLWQGAEFTDQDVEVDGNILTGKPQAHIEFAIHFASLLGLIDTEERAIELISYYKNLM